MTTRRKTNKILLSHVFFFRKLLFFGGGGEVGGGVVALLLFCFSPMHSKKKIKRIQTHNLRWEFQVTLLLLIAIGNKLRKTNLSRKLGTDVQVK